jgi:hypothetical protein
MRIFNLDFFSKATGELVLSRQHTNERHNGFAPEISPDGRWMAYNSDESGQLEVCVRPFPDVNRAKEQVSANGGVVPLWSPDGRKLYYRAGDAVMAVAVETEPAFKCGKPEVLFRGNYALSDRHPWDISPDGKRFLMMKDVGAVSSGEAGPRKIIVVTNWFEELRERVPVK